MKAIILEVRDGYAAALREDGLVVKTRQLAAVGETVELSEKVVQFPSQGRRIARTAVAAALALAVTGGAYTYTNVAAASYVTLDTEETSVELSVNRMGRVVGVRALDENSSELAESLAADVRRMKVEDAVDAAMQRMDGASTVVAGVTGDTEKRTADLQEAVERGADRAGRAEGELVTLEVSRDERREAGERSMSAGRWAFERGGGRWHEDDDDDRDDIDDRDGSDDDDLDDDDRPAFAPAPQNGVAPMTPPSGGDTPPAPSNGSAPAGQPPRMERDDDRDDDDDDRDDQDDFDDDDDFNDDDRPAPPEQNAQPPMQNGDQTPESGDTETPPERNGGQSPNGARNGGQTPPDAPGDGQNPSGEGPFAAAPDGRMQPPQIGEAPNGGPRGGPGGMQPCGAPQR